MTAHDLVAGPHVWFGADQQRRDDWILRLSADERAELERAAEDVRARGLTLDDVTLADFNLPTLEKSFAAVRDELRVGRGFVMVRGLPVEDYSDDELGVIFWGIGAHLGIGVSQSADGDRLGHVFDRGGDGDGRYYTVGGALEFHMDPIDVVGLLCLRAAVEGGASRIASAMAVHNVIAEERPDLLDILYQPVFNSRQTHKGHEQPASIPVFAEGADGVETFLLPVAVRSAEKEGYHTTDAQWEALNYLADVTRRPEIYLDMHFRPGDIQFLNNRRLYHARTDYRDHTDPALRRHLLRLWLVMPDWSPRVEPMKFIGNTDRAGGGVRPAAE